MQITEYDVNTVLQQDGRLSTSPCCSRQEGSGCSPVKVLRELGSIRRKLKTDLRLISLYARIYIYQYISFVTTKYSGITSTYYQVSDYTQQLFYSMIQSTYTAVGLDYDCVYRGVSIVPIFRRQMNKMNTRPQYERTWVYRPMVYLFLIILG